MTSPRGFVAATFFLLALPVAALYQFARGEGAEMMIHFMLATGSALLSSAIPGFRAPRWASWVGALSTGALALIFAAQGTAQLTGSEALTRLAFQHLGQDVEGWLGLGFLLWCFVAVLADGRGWRRTVGLVAVSLAAGARLCATVLPAAPVPKLLYLLPFVWLLAASGPEAG